MFIKFVRFFLYVPFHSITFTNFFFHHSIIIKWQNCRHTFFQFENANKESEQILWIMNETLHKMIMNFNVEYTQSSNKLCQHSIDFRGGVFFLSQTFLLRRI